MIHEKWLEMTEYDGPASAMDSDSQAKELNEARYAVDRLSIDHPDWLHRSRDLTLLLSKRFEETSRNILLTESIDIQRQICAVCTTGNPDRATSLCDLAISLRTLFNQTGEESLLTEAITLNREALSLRPTNHPDQSMSCDNLAYILWMRFNHMGDESLLAEAIILHRMALSLRDSGHPYRSMSCHNLAISLITYFDQTGEEALLTEAINLHKEALSLRPVGHPNRPESCNNLAVSLRIRFNGTGEECFLAEAISLAREALVLRPKGHPDRAMSCNTLAVLLWTRFTQIGEESILVESIDLAREALSLRPRGHPRRSQSCSNLALTVWTHFNQTGEESLLTEAIELHREAVSLQSNGHPERHRSCLNLGVSLHTRFNQTGEEALLTEAIELFREALSLRPNGHPLWPMSCNNLANSLEICFKQTGEESLLIEAIGLHREALSLRPSGHPHRYMSCSNLASALDTHFKQAREASLLVEAIHYHREALSLQTSFHPNRLEVCSRMVTSLRTHFELTGDESLLDEAIHLSKDAMETQPQHHPSRWNVIISLSYIYLNPRFSQHNKVLAIDYIQQALSLTPDDWPTLLAEVAQLTSLIDLPMISQDSLSQLLLCFSAAINLASRVAGFALDPRSQLRYLRDAQHLGPRAYWCALACRQPQLGLELLENSRAVVWTQALHMRNPQLSGAPPELASELEDLLSRMLNLRAAEDPMSVSSHNHDVRHKTSGRIHQLIQGIRALPGQERFMRGLSWKELAHCASRHAVVVLVAAEGECHALILRPNHQEPATLELSGISPDELTAMSIVISAAQRRGSAQDSVHENGRGMKALAFQTRTGQTRSNPVLGNLWTMVVRPIINHLQIQKASGSSRTRLHWCPTGPFMFLPLHAAGIYDASNTECCADYVVSSYTPTLTALLRAQKSSPSFHRREVKLGLVAAMKAWNVDLPTLQYVEDEINIVRAAAKSASISIDDSNTCVGNATTVARVSEVLKNTNLVHIACHGTQNTMNALSSGYGLGDGNLSISRLMDLDLKDAFFAFLSACETAKGDEKQPDQTIHLAAAMLFVGFRSVVATMWAMNDTDGPLIAELFYKTLFREDVITLDAIPYALDYAVGELRKTGVLPERWATFIHMGA